MKVGKIILIIILGTTVVGGIILGLINLMSGLDVIGKGSLKSFKVIIEELKENISFSDEWQSWALKAPDNSVTFYWSKDFSKSSFHDVMLEFAAKPFINAGLDINKMPDGYVIDNMIMVGTKLGNDSITYDGEVTPFESYKKIMELKRKSISYHAELDHYGIDLENGNMFEWAKDITKNDKDIVFVLNPEPFINAGVDPENVEGWVYAKVPMMKDSKKIEVYKFLKPYDIK